ncbi:MAG: hypothetical protein AB2693_01500 [Candidatus Thiodiazotropha sp.]
MIKHLLRQFDSPKQPWYPFTEEVIIRTKNNYSVCVAGLVVRSKLSKKYF